MTLENEVKIKSYNFGIVLIYILSMSFSIRVAQHGEFYRKRLFFPFEFVQENVLLSKDKEFLNLVLNCIFELKKTVLDQSCERRIF